MAMFSIGEIEELTGVKSHILRYWEENIPFLTPQKDFGGRRLYTSRDVQLVLRLKHLVYERKFTLDGALSQLLEEASAQGIDAAVRNLSLLKTELIDLYGIALSLRSKTTKWKNTKHDR